MYETKGDDPVRPRLDFGQQERLNELLRERGQRCPWCGSTEVASNGRYSVGSGGRIETQYVCWNRNTGERHPEGYGPFSTVLDPHEARRVGSGLEDPYG